MTLTPHPVGFMQSGGSDSPFEDAVMALSPVAAYLFRDTDFSTQIADSSGNGYHMAIQETEASRSTALRSTHPGGMAMAVTNWSTNGVHYLNSSGGLDVDLGGASSLSIVLGMQHDSKGGNDYYMFAMATESNSDWVLAVWMESFGSNDITFASKSDDSGISVLDDNSSLIGEPACYTYRFYDNGSTIDTLLDRVANTSDVECESGGSTGSTLSDENKTCFIGGRNNTNTTNFASGIIDHLSIFTPALSIASLDNLRSLYQDEIA